MTRLLITRPQEDAPALAAMLEAKGMGCLIAPMLAIETLRQNGAALAEALAAKPAAILLTSKHGVQALAAMSAERDISLFAVGRITADTAIASGFSRVTCAGGTAHHLVKHIRTRHASGAGTLLYACGEEVRVDIAAELAGDGIQVRPLPVYRAAKARALPAPVLDAVQSHALDGALFFSQRAAEAYVALTLRHGMPQAHTAMRALALSEGVADVLQPLPWHAIEVASTPDLTGMVALAEACFPIRK